MTRYILQFLNHTNNATICTICIFFSYNYLLWKFNN